MKIRYLQQLHASSHTFGPALADAPLGRTPARNDDMGMIAPTRLITRVSLFHFSS